jgi:hypothetical protein
MATEPERLLRNWLCILSGARVPPGNPISAASRRECRAALGQSGSDYPAHQGLELLKILPDTPERTQQELTLQIALGALLRATKGLLPQR